MYNSTLAIFMATTLHKSNRWQKASSFHMQPHDLGIEFFFQIWFHFKMDKVYSGT